MESRREREKKVKRTRDTVTEEINRGTERCGESWRERKKEKEREHEM